MKNQDLKEQYDLIYESISKKLDKQIESLNALDTKANILLAFIGILFTGYLTLFTNNDLGFRNYYVFVALELLSFVFAGFLVFKAFILQKKEIWRDDPRPSKLLSVFSKNSNKGAYWLKAQIIETISEAYELNDSLVIKKYNFLLQAKNILYFGIVVFLIHLVLTLFGIDKLIINLKF